MSRPYLNVSPQLSWDTTRQIWTWFKWLAQHLCKIKFLKLRNQRTKLSNPRWSTSYKGRWISQHFEWQYANMCTCYLPGTLICCACGYWRTLHKFTEWYKHGLIGTFGQLNMLDEKIPGALWAGLDYWHCLCANVMDGLVRCIKKCPELGLGGWV